MGETENSMFQALSKSVMQVPIRKVSDGNTTLQQDGLAVEEPLEIRIGYHFKGRPGSKIISVTMRTPGNDAELAAGFLLSEGVVRNRADIADIRHTGIPGAGSSVTNEIQVDLNPEVDIDFGRLERHFYTTSSCGVCGKTSLEAIEIKGCTPISITDLYMDSGLIHTLPERLRESQPVFAYTGGLHAAALFDETGNLLSVREDVGRHNALDKLVGDQFLHGQLPLSNRVLLVSGRASFELMQ